MVLKAVIETLEGVSDALKGEYKQGQDGKFYLAVEPSNGFALENVDGLKRALSSERDTRSKLESEMKRFEGVDPKRYVELNKRLSEMDNWDPDKKLSEHKTQFEKQVQEKFQNEQRGLVEKYETNIKQLSSTKEALTHQLQDALITREALSALQSAGASPVLLLPHVQQRARMKQLEDGRFMVEIINPQDGLPRFSPKPGSGVTPMSIGELVEELKASPEFAPAFPGSKASGTGASGNGGNPQKPGNPRVIKKGDQDAVNNNLEKIASGEVRVE